MIDLLTLDRDRAGRLPEPEEGPEAEAVALPPTRARRARRPPAAPPAGRSDSPTLSRTPAPIADAGGGEPARPSPERPLADTSVAGPVAPALEGAAVDAEALAPTPGVAGGPVNEPAPSARTRPAMAPAEALARAAHALLVARATSDRAWASLLAAATAAPAMTVEAAAETLAAAIQRRPVPARRRFLEALARRERMSRAPILVHLRTAMSRVVPAPPPPSPE